jgi:hypothetical protein
MKETRRRTPRPVSGFLAVWLALSPAAGCLGPEPRPPGAEHPAAPEAAEAPAPSPTGTLRVDASTLPAFPPEFRGTGGEMEEQK